MFGSGIGEPHEDPYYYEGWRDTGQGEPRPRDMVYDPRCSPAARTPEDQKKLDEFFCSLSEWSKSGVFFVKRPAFLEPPFFSKPLIKAKNALTVAPGATGLIFDRLIEDRQSAIAVQFGIDLAPLAPLYAGQLEFWFQRAATTGEQGSSTDVKESEVVPIFDDQTPTTYGGSTPIKSGRTTVLPGSVEIPYSFMKDGLTWGIRGRARIQMLMENKSGVEVTLRGVFGFYQYWAAGATGSAEWGSRDLQV
jgi:hypothetical protein